MNARRVGKSISSHNGFVGLNRHIHKAGNHAAYRINFLRIDLSFNLHTFVAFQYHGHFFERGVSGAFANAVDGYFHLAGSVHHSGNGIGSSHAQVVVAMGGDDCILDTFYILKQVFDFIPILPWKAITGCIRDIDHRGTGFNHGFHYAGQVHVVGSAGVFAVKFHIFHVLFGVFGGSNGPFQNFILCGIEFIFYMKFRSSNTGMNSFTLCKFEGFGSHFDVFLHTTCEGTDGWPCHGFGYFHYRIEITRT